MSNRPKARTTKHQARTTGAARSSPNPTGTRSGALLWIGISAVVAAAVVVGLVIAGGDDNNPAAEAREAVLEVGFAETIGDPLPPFTGEEIDPAVGTPAPKLRAQSMWTGEVVDVALDAGTVNVIGFFAHWCPHCQAEVPRVTAWLAENETPTNVEVIAISTAVDQGSPNYPPSEWFNREGWPTDVLTDAPEAFLSRGYGLTGFPYWVVVGPDGNVLERFSGEMSEEQFAALMQRAGDAV